MRQKNFMEPTPAGIRRTVAESETLIAELQCELRIFSRVLDRCADEAALQRELFIFLSCFLAASDRNGELLIETMPSKKRVDNHDRCCRP
jgi:hypothetical protein